MRDQSVDEARHRMAFTICAPDSGEQLLAASLRVQLTSPACESSYQRPTMRLSVGNHQNQFVQATVFNPCDRPHDVQRFNSPFQTSVLISSSERASEQNCVLAKYHSRYHSARSSAAFRSSSSLPATFQTIPKPLSGRSSTASSTTLPIQLQFK